MKVAAICTYCTHAKNVKIPKQTQAILRICCSQSDSLQKDHLSGRHRGVPPISNSAGDADIDAGEAEDIEEGIRRRPSAPAGSRADAGGTGRVPEEEVCASGALGNVTVSDRSSAMELKSTESSGEVIPIATFGISTTHICRTGVKEVLPEIWRKRRIAAEGISWMP